MLRITNLADYALILMCQIVREPDTLYSAASLSKIIGIPIPTVSKILGNLTRHNILISQRGLKGGFRLAGDRNEVSVTNVIEAIDGPIAVTSCIEEDNECDLMKICTMRPHWHAINNAVRQALENISIVDISHSPSHASLQKYLSLSGQTNPTQQ